MYKDMVKKTTYKSKEKLMEENAKLRQLLFNVYEKKAKAIYVLNNGQLHEDLDKNITSAYETWCKYNGV